MTADQPARQPGRGDVNVLVTAAGRRTGLVEAFGKAAHERGGRVYAADVDGLAPALYLADEAIRSLRTDDIAYVDDLLASVARHGIRLLVPTIDTDLPILARHVARFEAAGCRVAISSSAFIETTMDKHLSGLAFGAAGHPRAAIVDPAAAGSARSCRSRSSSSPGPGAPARTPTGSSWLSSTWSCGSSASRSSRRC